MEAQGGDNENMEVDGAGHARAGSTDDTMGVEAATASDGGAVEQPHEPVIVHVEVVMQENSRMRPADARGHVLQLLQAQATYFFEGPLIFSSSDALLNNVQSIQICDLQPEFQREGLGFWQADPRVHVYYLSDDGASEEYTDDSEDAVNSSQQWMLPAREFHGLWENLIYDHEIKNQLLAYCNTLMLFSDKNVDSAVIAGIVLSFFMGLPARKD